MKCLIVQNIELVTFLLISHIFLVLKMRENGYVYINKNTISYKPFTCILKQAYIGKYVLKLYKLEPYKKIPLKAWYR